MASVVFMGTPDFAVPTLEALLQHHFVLGVVTQPDRRAGRGQAVQMSPVKQVALRAGVAVLQPERLRRPDAIEALRAWPADLFVVAAFGQILPQAVLDLPPHGCVNVHASLLPRWRGAAPIHAAVRAGDATTGITIMQMDAGLDTGPMLAQRAVPIPPDATTGHMHDMLARLGAELLVEVLPGVLNGGVRPQPQDDAYATYAPQLQKDEGRLSWAQPAEALARTVRAFTPWPGTFTTWNGQRLKVLAADAAPGHAAPGLVVPHGDGLAVGTATGLFVPRRVQVAGGKPLDARDARNGYPALLGSVLGTENTDTATV